MDKEDILTLIEIAEEDKTPKLDLSNREIDELPAEIGRLTELKQLILSYNNISTLPPEIGNLKNLESLLLLRNKLTSIPVEICGLSKLTLLELSHNYITELPEEIGELSELTTLDISYCQIDKLPLSFTKLISLKDLYLENNRFQFPPEKVLKRGLYATMYFLTEEQKKRDAKKINVQIFNMPIEAQLAFKQYIECFNGVVTSKYLDKFNFDIGFINTDNEDVKTDKQLQNYFFDFVQYIKENIGNFNQETANKDKINLFDLQVLELRNQIRELNKSLDGKVQDIQEIQAQLLNLSNKLG